jgi:sterol desaturase/sphingolipid hydroxylase (fatty acid hydroxylase superfamily)
MDLSNWFGLTQGQFIGKPPLYVNKELGPGLSNVPIPSLIHWVKNSPLVILKSPNFVWAVIALLVYNFAPYNLTLGTASLAGPLTYQFFLERFPLWLTLVHGYTSFWHIILYFTQLAKRPFIQNRIYNLDKVAHNFFWTTSGIAIFTAFENVMCYLWATQRLSYVPDSESFGSISGLCLFLLALGGIPLWRSIHFYFAHRFLHMDAIYKQVHSLHHRNTDIEPFSGLCMHPVEHLYYFSCIAPSLIVYCSPFAFLWNGIHLLLSPAASHSGYEDHFQSDVFHYMHHRYFECNYAGTDAAFLDHWFGTFKGTFDEEDRSIEGPSAREDAKSRLSLIPTREFMTYLAASGLCVVPWILRSHSEVSSLEAAGLSALVGFGPIAMASIVSTAFGTRRGVTPVKMTVFGNLLHIAIGTLFCSMPITYLVWLTLQSQM